MKIRLVLIVIVIAFVFVGCQKSTGPAPLPDDQAAPAIGAVKSFALGDGTTLASAISIGIESLKKKGAKVDELGWFAFPGSEDCGGCVRVDYAVKINGETERYSFLAKDSGKKIEGMNDGAVVLLNSRKAKPKEEKNTKEDEKAEKAEEKAPAKNAEKEKTEKK